MSTVRRTRQLRRYELVPDYMDQFVPWWRTSLLPVRLRYGFHVDVAVLSRDTFEFMWIVSVDGDATRFEECERAYAASPERAAAFTGSPEFVVRQHISFVEDVDVAAQPSTRP